LQFNFRSLALFYSFFFVKNNNKKSGFSHAESQQATLWKRNRLRVQNIYQIYFVVSVVCDVQEIFAFKVNTFSFGITIHKIYRNKIELEYEKKK